jgi:colanic acid/amylovoran biosynthesis glycosyltransferase
MQLRNGYKNGVLYTLTLICTIHIYASEQTSKASILFITKEFPSAVQGYITNEVIGAQEYGHLVGIYAPKQGDASFLEPQIRNKLAAATYHVLSDLKKYDVIVCEWGDLGEQYAKIKAEFPNVIKSLMIRFRGDPEECTTQYKAAFVHGTKLVPVCDFFKEQLLAKGCPAHKLAVIRSGIITKNFMRSKPPRLLKLRKNNEDNLFGYMEPDPYHITSTGRLVEKKGFAYLIDALSYLWHTMNIHTMTTIIGDGPLRNELVKRIEDKKMSPFITLVGQKTQPEIKEYLKKTHIFVLSSITSVTGDSEGIANVLKEAMLSVPVVATDHGGNKELIIDEVTGFLVSEKEMKEDTTGEILARGIVRCINFKNIADMYQRAQEKVIQDYDMHNIAPQFSKLVQQIADKTA